MKSIVRTFVFVSIALFISQYFIKAFDYGSEPARTFIFVAIALSVLYFLLKPVLKIAFLPIEGIGYLFILMTLTFAVLYVLTLFIPSFAIKPATISNLIIFGFVIPSKSFSSFWAGVVSAAVIGVVYSFFLGLCSKK